VFIKAGAGGGISGYKDKYLRMAHREHERLGATVICSSNYAKSLPMDKKAIEWCARYLKLEDVELYFVGVSDGADQCIILSRNAPTKKLICINPSFVPGHDPSDRLIIRSKVEKIFVYGTKDDEAYELVPKLKERAIPNFEIRWVEGADHSFTGMVDEFIALIDLI
jgi:alpha/beta superfamily hydrolase